MRWYLAIPFSCALLYATMLLSGLLNFNLQWFLLLGTALWAAVDSSKIKLSQYKSAMPYKPVTVFLVVCLLWIIGFPWYLAVRHRIKSGKGVLREDPNSHSGILSGRI